MFGNPVLAGGEVLQRDRATRRWRRSWFFIQPWRALNCFSDGCCNGIVKERACDGFEVLFDGISDAVDIVRETVKVGHHFV